MEKKKKQVPILFYIAVILGALSMIPVAYYLVIDDSATYAEAGYLVLIPAALWVWWGWIDDS